MRHQVKKIKIKFGKDANKMLLKKLLRNFLIKGKLTTTLTRAKLLKSLIERIVSRVKNSNEKNKKYVSKYISDKKILNFLFQNVNNVFQDLIGGYVKIIKLGMRSSDGSLMGQVVWTRPVVFEEKKSKNKKFEDKKNKFKKEVNQ